MLSIIYWSLKLTSVNDLILESSYELAFSDERHMMADFSYRSSIFAIVTPIFEKISFMIRIGRGFYSYYRPIYFHFME